MDSTELNNMSVCVNGTTIWTVIPNGTFQLRNLRHHRPSKIEITGTAETPSLPPTSNGRQICGRFASSPGFGFSCSRWYGVSCLRFSTTRSPVPEHWVADRPARLRPAAQSRLHHDLDASKLADAIRRWSCDDDG